MRMHSMLRSNLITKSFTIVLSILIVTFVYFTLYSTNVTHFEDFPTIEVKSTVKANDIRENRFYLCSGLPLAARLGNILYACGSLLGLAERFNATVVLTFNHFQYLSRMFHLKKFYVVDDHACDPNENILIISERWPSKYDSNILKTLQDVDNKIGLKRANRTIRKSVIKPTGLNIEGKVSHVYGHNKNDNTFVKINGFLQSWRYFANINMKLEYSFHDWIKNTITQILSETAETLFCQNNSIITSSSRMFSHFSNTSIKNKMTFKGKIIRCKNSGAPKKVLEVIFVGIHVRRSDMLSRDGVLKGYQVATKEYINKSIHFIQSQFSRWRDEEYKNVPLQKNFVEKTLVFVVASDDNSWAQQTIRSSYPVLFSSQLYLSTLSLAHLSFPSETVSSSLSSILLKELAIRRANMGDILFGTIMDFAFISNCNHVIMTVGSFGWWAGYLSEGTVIYYKDYPKPDTEIFAGFSAVDYYPSNWIAMS